MKRNVSRCVCGLMFLLVIFGAVSCGGYSEQDEQAIAQGRAIAQRFRTWIDQNGEYPESDSMYVEIGLRGGEAANVYTSLPVVITSWSNVPCGTGDYFISQMMSSGDGDFVFQIDLKGPTDDDGYSKWTYRFRLDRTMSGVIQEEKMD